MQSLTKFELDKGGSILIEAVGSNEQHGVVRANKTGDLIATSKVKFEEAISQIKPFVSPIIQNLQDLPKMPDEIKVEFGVKLSANAGAFIASASSEASIKINLQWKKNTIEKF